MMNRNLVYVVGLGPGNAQFLTAQARAALQNADVLWRLHGLHRSGAAAVP